jgi:hypothetical protein
MNRVAGDDLTFIPDWITALVLLVQIQAYVVTREQAMNGMRADYTIANHVTSKYVHSSICVSDFY